LRRLAIVAVHPRRSRWPSENAAENLGGVATKSLEAELGAPSRTKYGLYTGRFDKKRPV